MSVSLVTNIFPLLIALLIFVILFFSAWVPIERGRKIELRTLPGLNRLRRLIGESAENGQRVHYAPGSGGLDGQSGTAETFSSLTSLASVAQTAARSKVNLTVSTNETLTYLIANDVVESEYIEVGRREDFQLTDVQFVTQQDRMAYIAAVNSRLTETETGSSIVLGRFDSEYLLAGDIANRRNIPQVAGSSRIEAMPLMVASAGPDNSLLGEEIYAVPAYLDRQPARLASLVAQDRSRLIIVLVIIVGVIVSSLGIVPDLGNFFLR